MTRLFSKSVVRAIFPNLRQYIGILMKTDNPKVLMRNAILFTANERNEP